MKKISTVAMLLAFLIAPLAMGAPTTETETVPDESQGLLLNGFWDNWYISIDGGASVFFSPEDEQLDFTKRIAPNAGLNFGKWWTPIFGTRIGVDYMSGNCAATSADAYGYMACLVATTPLASIHSLSMVDLVMAMVGPKTKISIAVCGQQSFVVV